MIVNDYILVDTRDARPTPEPTLRQRRDAVTFWAKEVQEWADELAQHPRWIRAAHERHGRLLGELQRALNAPADAGELVLLAMIDAGDDRAAALRARHMLDQYRAEIAANPLLDRANVARRSAFVPRELSLAEQQLMAAKHELAAAEARRAAVDPDD